MADVFVSYKREEIEIARLVSNTLQQEGFSTFFDAHDERGIDVGEPWDVRLERELKEARAVVVLWSAASVASHNVRDEARRAHARDALVPARLGPCDVPLGLGAVQTADLSRWDGDRGDANWRILVDKGVSRLVRPNPNAAAASRPLPSPPPPPPSTPEREKKFRFELKNSARPFGNAPIASLLFSVDSDYLAAISRGGEAVALRWDTGQVLGKKLRAPLFAIECLAFGQRGLSPVAQSANGRLRKWTSVGANASEPLGLPASERVVSLAATMPGVRVVTEQKNNLVRMYDVGVSPALLSTFTKPATWGRCLGVDLSGTRLLFIERGSACIADARDGSVQTMISAPNRAVVDAQFSFKDRFSSGDNVAMILDDRSIAYWDSNNSWGPKLKCSTPFVGGVSCLTETWGGLISGSPDRGVRLHSRSWSNLSVECEVREHDAPVSAVAAAGGKIASASISGEIRLFSLEYD